MSDAIHRLCRAVRRAGLVLMLDDSPIDALALKAEAERRAIERLATAAARATFDAELADANEARK